jgi:hypothetical protein
LANRAPHVAREGFAGRDERPARERCSVGSLQGDLGTRPKRHPAQRNVRYSRKTAVNKKDFLGDDLHGVVRQTPLAPLDKRSSSCFIEPVSYFTRQSAHAAAAVAAATMSGNTARLAGEGSAVRQTERAQRTLRVNAECTQSEYEVNTEQAALIRAVSRAKRAPRAGRPSRRRRAAPKDPKEILRV